MAEGEGRRVIVTAMRNEGPYILEWVAYHRLIGFSDFVVYTNDCDDGTGAILDRLGALGLGVHHRANRFYRAHGPQWAALRAASADPLVQGAGWVLVADVDEFVCIAAGGGRLDDLAAAIGPAQFVTLHWRFFGNDGVEGIDGGPVIERFTGAAPLPLCYPLIGLMYKTLFRPEGQLQRLGVHMPRLKKGASSAETVWVNGAGRRLRGRVPERRRGKPLPQFLQPSEIDGRLVRLNHYALRSIEGFLVKSARGLPNRRHQEIGLGYFIQRNHSAERDLTIQRHLPALAGMLAEWRADPLLARLEAAALDWHLTEAHRIMATPEGFALYAALKLLGPSVAPARTTALGLLQREHAVRAGGRAAAPPDPASGRAGGGGTAGAGGGG